MKPDDPNFNWDSEEGKQATARWKSFLRNIDEGAAAEGLVRKVVTLGKDDNGEELKIMTWEKP